MKRRTCLLLLSGLLLLFSRFKSEAQSVDSTAYNIAFYYFDHWNLDKAIYWFDKSIEAKYKVAKSYMFRGSAKSLAGNLTGALNDLDTSYKLDSTNTDIFLYYARLYLFQKRYDAGLIAINRAIAGDSTDAHYFDCRGTLYLNLLKYNMALRDADHAILLDSNSTYINNRGIIKQKMGNYANALHDFELALITEPGDPTILTNIALCNYKLKKFDNALAICNDVLSKQPHMTFTLATRGEILFMKGNKKGACADFETLSAIDANLGKKYLEKYCK